MKTEKLQARLLRALQETTMVVISARPQPEDVVRGFVVSISKKWVLVLATDPGGYHDGYTALRIIDLVKIKRDKSFRPQFARTQSYWPPKAPSDVDLSSTTATLNSLVKDGEIYGIESTLASDVMWVGVTQEITKKYLYLHEVRTDATWYSEPLGYRLRDITRVYVDSQYLRAIASIAGKTPAL